jgi:glucose/arabinose dehydrogenase/cytochrome c2
MRLSPRVRFVAAAVLACLLCFAMGVLVAGGGRQIKARLAHLSDMAVKRVAILVQGEDRFVQAELDRNYRKQDVPEQGSPRVLDTSRLPLTLELVPLAGQGVFAASEELVRGALATVNGQVFAMDKLGNVFRVEDRSLRKLDFGTFPNAIDRYIVDAPRGLPRTSIRTLYLAHDRARNRLLVSHQRYVPQTRHVRFTISALPIDPTASTKAGEWKTVFETEDIPDNSAFRGATGGKLVVSGDTLYFSVGDYNFGQVPQDDAALVAQNPRSSFGKVYELDMVSGRHKVKSIGHRNPQGLVLTRAGRLMDTEHGPEGGDELNIVKDGANFGWPYRTYGTDYGAFNWPLVDKTPPGQARYADPTYSWVPSVAVSPVIEIDGFNEAWDGDLLVGSLKAQSLFRLRMVDDRVVFAEPIWIGHRIRDIVQLPDRIVLMTDDPALVVLRVDQKRLKENSKLQKHVEFSPALATCLNCHHFGPTNPSHLAPSLGNVLGRRIAADSFDRYSDALRRKEGTWDEATLARFLSNPGEFAPGTAMPNLGLTPQQVADVVAALGKRAPEVTKAQ